MPKTFNRVGVISKTKTMKKNTLLFLICFVSGLISYKAHSQQNKSIQATATVLPAGTSYSSDGKKVTILAGYSAVNNPDGSISITNNTSRAIVGAFRCDGCGANEEGSCDITVDSDGKTITCSGSCTCRLLVKVKTPAGSKGTKGQTTQPVGINLNRIEWTPVKFQ